MESRKLTILFLCTGNSCRSQMAEGFANRLKSDVLKAYSAGIESHGLDPYAVRAMRESGVDISQQRSKTLDELPGIEFDYVVTLCSDADERCPFFPGNTTIMHRGFDDPPALAAPTEIEEEKLVIYRRVRDEIKAFVESLPEFLSKSDEAHD